MTRDDMSLQHGTTLGPYRVLDTLGEGGMGEVYRARDPALKRDVAVKVLPEAVAGDPDRLARFRREAQVLASLSHPGIAHVYGLEEADGVRAIVMELVDGDTLAERIAGGPLPLEDALAIASQVADALEAAHARGIVHRDLKPANVKVRPDGTVKVLDFGLAKLTAEDDAASASTRGDTAEAPTTMASHRPAPTRSGMVLGTAAYMSPEQARGRPVDRRTDVWAFGCLLYEMLSGRAAFAGDDPAHTLALVVEREPDWDAVPEQVPPSVVLTIRRCLQKDPDARLHCLGDARLAMTGAFATSPSTREAVASSSSRSRRAALVTGLALAAAASGLTAWLVRAPPPVSRAPGRFAIVLPHGDALGDVDDTNEQHRQIAISPQGSHVAYVADGRLFVRVMDRLQATPVPDSEGATEPFFAPDGRSIGFWARGSLWRAPVDGGAPVAVCETAPVFGASWLTDDTIVFNVGGIGISRVAARGGSPEVVVPIRAGERGLPAPQLLPGGEWILFSIFPSRHVAVQSLETGERRVLLDTGGGDPRYLSTGHLVHVRNGQLVAMPFDPVSLTLTDEPVALVDGIAQGWVGLAQFAVADNGTLVYVPRSAGQRLRRLAWVGRDGMVELLEAESRLYDHPRLSPDGTRVAVSARDDDQDVWIWDLARRVLTRLTEGPSFDAVPVWTPDGERIAFASTRSAGRNLFWTRADGGGAVEQLTSSLNGLAPYGFSPDGADLLIDGAYPGSAGLDLAVLAMRGTRSIEPLLVTGFDELDAEVSPDGRWMAYQSNASGSPEIYVRPYPDVDAGRWQISSGGGAQPLWAPDGRELFYRMAPDRVMRVAASGGRRFRAGSPELLLEVDAFMGNGRNYDIAPDGRRFLMLVDDPDARAADPLSGLNQIHVVLDWLEELRTRVPIR